MIKVRRQSVSRSLGNQSTLPESAAIQSLVSALKDEVPPVKYSAALALDKRSTLLESAIQSVNDALKNEGAEVRKSAISVLGNQSMLPELATQSSNRESMSQQHWASANSLRYLISCQVLVPHENTDVRDSAASVLGKQSTLPEPFVQSLNGALKDKDHYVGCSAASAFGNQSSLPQSAIQSQSVREILNN